MLYRVCYLKRNRRPKKHFHEFEHWCYIFIIKLYHLMKVVLCCFDLVFTDMLPPGRQKCFCHICHIWEQIKLVFHTCYYFNDVVSRSRELHNIVLYNFFIRNHLSCFLRITIISSSTQVRAVKGAIQKGFNRKYLSSIIVIATISFYFFIFISRKAQNEGGNS